MDTLILATEELGKIDLMGQLRGLLVVIFAIGMFCGSVYLLLATNLGNQLAFLVSFASVTGFISMLAMVWATSQFPLNSLHGPQPAWHVREVVADPGEAHDPLVRRIEQEGRESAPTAAGEIKAAVDTALTAPEGEFQQYNATTDYVSTTSREIGGGKSGLFGHKPLWAVVEVRPVVKVEPLPGQAPPRPRADPSKPPQYVVLERDLGALRLPQYVTMVAFGILFLISLWLLHTYERSKQKAGSELEPKPAIA